MTEKNLNQMTESELRDFVLKNPRNTEVFHAYIDKVNQEYPNRKPMSAEEAIAEIERKVNQNV